jgi:cytochrome c551/c552
MKIRFVVDNLRENYIHHLALFGIRSAEGGHPLLHSSAYYTLKQIPDGEELSVNELTVTVDESIPESVADELEPESVETASDADGSEVPSYEVIEPLLAQYTCTACHNTNERQVGPPFSEIAERGYTKEEMVELMYNPDLSNWPDYATAMPPMTIVPREEALKIAEWINSLDD